jgi:hypothetical protein
MMGLGKPPYFSPPPHKRTILTKRMKGSEPVEVYHGTDRKHLENIKREGLKEDPYNPGPVPGSGQGLHVSIDPDLSKQYAKGENGVLLKAKLPRGRLYVNKSYTDPDAWEGRVVGAQVRGGHIPPEHLHILDKKTGRYEPLLKDHERGHSGPGGKVDHGWEE